MARLAAKGMEFKIVDTDIDKNDPLYNGIVGLLQAQAGIKWENFQIGFTTTQWRISRLF